MEIAVPKAADSWGGLEPYTQVLSALVPKAEGFEIYDAASERRCATSDVQLSELPALVAQQLAIATADATAVGAMTVLPGDVPACVFPLRQSDGVPMAALAIHWPDTRSGPRDFASVHALLRPAIECLRRELATRGNLRQLDAALQARDRDLEMLLASSVASSATDESYDLGALLHTAIGHLQCRFGVLVVPEKNLMLARHAPGGDEAKHRQALAATHRHLLALAQHRTGALVLNQVPQPTGREPVPYRIVTCAVRYPTGRPMGVLALYRDLAEAEFVDREAQLLDLLARRAASIIQVSYDSLTGLMNRTAFEHRVRVVTSGRDGHWSLLYLDIDQLHLINDNCGMHTGDRVIAQIGALIRALLVPNSHAARLSGDRLVVLLPTDLEAAQGFAEAVRQGVTGVQAGSLDRGNDAHPLVSVSIGVAPLRGGEEFSHVAVIAETACKAAKDRGRNRVEVYRASDASLVRRYEDVNIIPNLRVAMSEDRLRLDAQLIVPMQASTSARWHFELLLRMIDTNGQTVGPDRFLSAAVRYQLMPMIDRWVVEHAISLLREHRTLLESRAVVFTVNLSGQSLTDPAFPDFLVDAIERSGLDPAIFCFELTESAAVGNLEVADSVMRRLRALGCSIALDDFGTGQSSLAYLRSLPIDMLKIDGSFVRDILRDARAESMVQAIAHLARAMQLTTVAEYVETDEIRLRVAALGVDYGQGFAIARPAPLVEVLEELPLYATAEEITVVAETLQDDDGLSEEVLLVLEDEAEGHAALLGPSR